MRSAILDRRISLFLSLPLATLEKLAIQKEIERLGSNEDYTCAAATAEFLGTLFLLAAVVGSGIMGERLAAGNVAIGAPGQYRRHRGRASGVDSGVRSGFRRAFESCRDTDRRVAG